MVFAIKKETASFETTSFINIETPEKNNSFIKPVILL